MLDLRLDTAGGEAYVASSTIVWVSAAFKKGNYPETRSVGLSSGHTIYMLNTPENIGRLRASGVGDTIREPATKDKPRRRAGAGEPFADKPRSKGERISRLKDELAKTRPGGVPPTPSP